MGLPSYSSIPGEVAFPDAGLCLGFSFPSRVGCIFNLGQGLPVWSSLNALKSFQTSVYCL